MTAALVAFLIAALIILVIAYVIIYVIDFIPGVPTQLATLAKIIVGLIALLIILSKALPLLGV